MWDIGRGRNQIWTDVIGFLSHPTSHVRLVNPSTLSKQLSRSDANAVLACNIWFYESCLSGDEVTEVSR